jgi:hypothetical protein
MDLTRKTSPNQQIISPNSLPDLPPMPTTPWDRGEMAAWDMALQQWWRSVRESLQRDRDAILKQVNRTQNQVDNPTP